MHGRDHDFGIVVEQRDDLLGRGIVGNLRVAVQVAVPQHGADLLGDPAHDPSAHDSPAGIAAKVGFGECSGHPGKCGGLERQLEKRGEPFQRGDRGLAKAIRRIAGPGRIDAIHLADHALVGKPVNECQIIGHAFVAGLLEAEKIDRVPGSQAAPQHLLARLQEMKEHAAPPAFRRLALVRASVFPNLGRLRPVGAPQESAAFVNRVKRVEDNEGACQRHPGFDNAPAEPGHQLGFAAADQPGLGHPPGEFVKSRLVHI